MAGFLVADDLAHGAWDWLHHARVVPPRVAARFSPGCSTFDLATAVVSLTFV